MQIALHGVHLSLVLEIISMMTFKRNNHRGLDFSV